MKTGHRVLNIEIWGPGLFSEYLGCCLISFVSRLALAFFGGWFFSSRVPPARWTACPSVLGYLLAIYWRSIGDLLAIPIGDLVAILFFAGICVFRGKKS